MTKAYHGTSPENARAIMESGAFRVGTWFADEKADAIKFGGLVVFTVELDPKGFKNGNPDDWQFHLRDPLSVDVVTNVEGME